MLIRKLQGLLRVEVFTFLHIRNNHDFWLNSVYCNLGEELFAGIEVNVTQTDMDRSREIYDGEKITETEETTTKTPTWIAQPKSKWRDVSVRFAMSKRFDF